MNFCLTGPLQSNRVHTVAVFVFLHSVLYFLAEVQHEEASEKKIWESSWDHLLSFKTFVWIIEEVCGNNVNFQKYTQGGRSIQRKEVVKWRRRKQSEPDGIINLSDSYHPKIYKNMESKPLWCF